MFKLMFALAMANRLMKKQEFLLPISSLLCNLFSYHFEIAVYLHPNYSRSVFEARICPKAWPLVGRTGENIKRPSITFPFEYLRSLSMHELAMCTRTPYCPVIGIHKREIAEILLRTFSRVQQEYRRWKTDSKCVHKIFSLSFKSLEDKPLADDSLDHDSCGFIHSEAQEFLETFSPRRMEGIVHDAISVMLVGDENMEWSEARVAKQVEILKSNRNRLGFYFHDSRSLPDTTKAQWIR